MNKKSLIPTFNSVDFFFKIPKSKIINDNQLILIFSLLYFLIHNITNDLIYSPDAIIFFMIILGFKDSITDQVNLEN